MKRHGHLARAMMTLAGIPQEIVFRSIGRKWVNHSPVQYHDRMRGKYLTAPRKQVHDGFTSAPNLYRQDGQMSWASRLHDHGWDYGEWDDGTILTFDDNNRIFRIMLEREGHAAPIVAIYHWGVSREFMRKKWEAKHGHA